MLFFCSMNRSLGIFALCIDRHLGKVDKSTLAQQSLMEILISGFTDCKYKICGYEDTPTDILNWRGITLNETDDVVGIHWAGRLDSYFRLYGTIDLNALPLTVQAMDVSRNSLDGSIDLTGLPKVLKYLYLHQNAFAGSACLTSLPEAMVSLNLSENYFSGHIDVTQLPKGIRELRLNRTSLDGDTDLSQLPESLRVFNVENTNLFGKVEVRQGKEFSVENSQVKIYWIE
uniref:Leucine-rich repeat protein n=1 Tax=Paramoeba aestuarina TaxID=180227 RepID=A0A7S4KXA6_9EUKA|mmetsp:Transcript_27126/g.42207  ORF Transcript_27126/g.42207 Transcript_27126/m.42207 type:complete len:230 (+) Transcript_27126:3-692(+)